MWRVQVTSVPDVSGVVWVQLMDIGETNFTGGVATTGGFIEGETVDGCWHRLTLTPCGIRSECHKSFYNHRRGRGDGLAAATSREEQADA